MLFYGVFSTLGPDGDMHGWANWRAAPATAPWNARGGAPLYGEELLLPVLAHGLAAALRRKRRVGLFATRRGRIAFTYGAPAAGAGGWPPAMGPPPPATTPSGGSTPW